MVDRMACSMADAKRVIGAVCVPCVLGRMVQAPSPCLETATRKCELVHIGIGGPRTESLGGSIYVMRALEDSTEFITATSVKTKGMAPDVLTTRIKQLERQTGVIVKRVRRESTKKYVTTDLKAWYGDKGSTWEITAPYKSQQNGKAERVIRTLIERVHAGLLDAGAEEELSSLLSSATISWVLLVDSEATPTEHVSPRRRRRGLVGR